MDPLERGVKENMRVGKRGARRVVRDLFSFKTFEFFLTLFIFGSIALALFSFGVFGDTTIGVSLGGFGQNKDLSNGLVGHWTFDGPDMLTRVADTSGAGNHGTLSSGFTSTTTVSGTMGQGLSFDGINDYVLTTYAPNLTSSSDISFSMWFTSNRTSFTSDQDLVASSPAGGGVVQVEIDGDGSRCSDDRIGLLMTDAGDANWDIVCSTTAITKDGWHHLVATYDVDGMMILYIDGVKINTTTVTANSNGNKDLSGNPFMVGANNGGGTAQEFFDGSLDDVRIYTRALSAEEAKRLYDLGATTHVSTSLGGVGENKDLSSGLVAHYTFDGPDMLTRVADVSAQGRHGYLSGFTSTTTVRGKLGQALEFDGNNDLVSIGNTNETVYAHAFWAYLPNGVTAASGCQAPYNWGSNSFEHTGFGSCSGYGNNETFSIRDNGPGDIRFTYITDTLTPGWHHIVANWDAAQSKFIIWLDGVQKSTVTGNSGDVTLQSWTSLQIGASTPNGGLYFSGYIDDVRFYNRSLSSEEIARLYGLGNTAKIGTTLGGVGENKDLSSGLVGHWTFDGPNLLSNATDSSGSGNTGYLTSFTSTTTVRGKLGQALLFDGSDDYVLENASPNTSVTNWTLSAWMKPNNLSQMVMVVYNGNDSGGYGFGMSDGAGGGAGGKLSGLFGQVAWLNSNYTFPEANQWYHVTMTRDSSTTRFYVDGVLQATTFASTPGTVAQKFTIGNQLNGSNVPTRFFSGEVDDVRVYNRALSAEEVQRLYQLGQ